MRERSRDKGRLEDIVEYSNNVTRFVEGKSYEELMADRLTYYAVMKNVEIVGEAAYMLTKAFKTAHSETPWKIVQGMRHVLVHDYANIVSETLYDTAKNGIPELRAQVERYLVETDWETWENTKDASDYEEAGEKRANLILAQRMRQRGYDEKEIYDLTGVLLEDDF